MATTPSPLHDSAFLDAMLDLVIPPSADGEMPGAGSLGISPFVADAIASDTRFGPGIEAGLRAVRSAADERGGFAQLTEADRLAVVESVSTEHPALMSGLARYVFHAYYQSPRVLAGLGQPARPPFPEGFQVEETDPELLDILEARKRT